MRSSITLTATMILAGTLAQAQEPQQCFSFEAGVSAAQRQYGEVPVFIGSTRGVAVMLTLNPVDGSWTLWEALTAGTLCVVRSGRDWIAAPKPVIPAPSTPDDPPTLPQVWKLHNRHGFMLYAGG